MKPQPATQPPQPTTPPPGAGSWCWNPATGQWDSADDAAQAAVPSQPQTAPESKPE